MDYLTYQHTPVQEINDRRIDAAGIRLLVKREDLNHPTVSGNKWWKLKYNLSEAKRQNLPVLTFGGAYSNHIYATAAAAHLLRIGSTGIIRGERIDPLNNTLSFAENKGMKLHFVSRSDYKRKNENTFIDELRAKFGDFYMVPEGGTNLLAVEACASFAHDHLLNIDFDHLFLPVGTGGTMAGIIAGIKGKKKVSGISVLRNGDFLEDEVRNLLKTFSVHDYGNWRVLTSYDHGGYAKTTKSLLDFVGAMKDQHNLPLDPVYTGKLMWAVFRQIEERQFARGTTVLALHTGGLQGADEYSHPMPTR
jgi:1-aminocyclopropane-1-carboxylate deaminase